MQKNCGIRNLEFLWLSISCENGPEVVVAPTPWHLPDRRKYISNKVVCAPLSSCLLDLICFQPWKVACAEQCHRQACENAGKRTSLFCHHFHVLCPFPSPSLQVAWAPVSLSLAPTIFLSKYVTPAGQSTCDATGVESCFPCYLVCTSEWFHQSKSLSRPLPTRPLPLPS